MFDPSVMIAWHCTGDSVERDGSITLGGIETGKIICSRAENVAPYGSRSMV